MNIDDVTLFAYLLTSAIITLDSVAFADHISRLKYWIVSAEFCGLFLFKNVSIYFVIGVLTWHKISIMKSISFKHYKMNDIGHIKKIFDNNFETFMLLIILITSFSIEWTWRLHRPASVNSTRSTCASWTIQELNTGMLILLSICMYHHRNHLDGFFMISIDSNVPPTSEQNYLSNHNILGANRPIY